MSERPTAIARFELLMLIALGLGVVAAAISWPQATEIAEPWFVLTVQSFVFLFTLALVLLVSRKASNVARWVLLILTVVGIVFYIPSAGQMLAFSPVLEVIAVVQIVLEVVALVAVFSPSARPWFAKQPKDAP